MKLPSGDVGVRCLNRMNPARKRQCCQIENRKVSVYFFHL
jgi:hypothetical protein